MSDILDRENESHSRALAKVNSLRKRIGVIINLKKRDAPLTNLGRFMKMVESPVVAHDPKKVREGLGYE